MFIDYQALVRAGQREQAKATTVAGEIRAWESALSQYLGPPEGPGLTAQQRRLVEALSRRRTKTEGQ